VNTKLGQLAYPIVTAVVGIAFLAATASAGSSSTERLHQSWRAAIARTPVPGKGCFTASYPVAMWRQVGCVKAPNVPFIPRGAARGSRQVGNGHDYEAVTKRLISSAVGSFPVVKRLKSESDPDMFGANDYSLQLNSNFMPDNKKCAEGAADPTQCSAWQQFIYASGYNQAFMQYWLIHWNTGCPPGWVLYGDGVGLDCYMNSAAVSVPLQVITELPNMSLEGAAVKYGLDTLTLTTSTQAYAVTGDDNVTFLARGWNGSEFNIVGDGNGSEADFNPGTSLTVRIALTTAAQRARCAADSGTTGETNNLNLGGCRGTRGTNPSIQFVESLPKP